MEHRVDLHRFGKTESDGVRRAEMGIGHDFERPEAAVVQFARRAASGDVPGVQPDLVAGEEAWGGEPLPIGVGGGRRRVALPVPVRVAAAEAEKWGTPVVLEA